MVATAPFQRLRAAAGYFLAANQQVLAAALVGLTLGALVLLIEVPAGFRALGDYRPDCSVRAARSDFSLELSGWRAGAACRQLVTNTQGLSEGSASGSVICTAKVEGLRETVRDNSFLPLVGALVCVGLHAPSPVPSRPSPQRLQGGVA